MTPMQRPADLADREFLTLTRKLAVRQGEVAERSSLDNRPRTQTGRLQRVLDGARQPEPPHLAGDRSAQRPAAGADRARSSTGRPCAPIPTLPTRFDSWLDFNKLDRCITRGLPGAMMPGFYNHNYQIVQSEDYVVILVEMIHDARIIPLDGRGPLDPGLRQWLGDVARPLGRRHARHRDHQLQRQDHRAVAARSFGGSPST